jgi:hypothetical protein
MRCSAAWQPDNKLQGVVAGVFDCVSTVFAGTSRSVAIIGHPNGTDQKDPGDQVETRESVEQEAKRPIQKKF